MSEANEYEALVKRIKSKLSVVEWELLKKQSDGSWSATAEEAEMLERIKEKLTVEEWEALNIYSIMECRTVGCCIAATVKSPLDTLKEWLGLAEDVKDGAEKLRDLFDDTKNGDKKWPPIGSPGGPLDF